MRTSTLVACPLFLCAFIVMLRAEEPSKAQLHPRSASARSSSELRSHLNGIMRKRNNVQQAHSCVSDRECGTGLYCHAPRHTHSQCSPCRRRGRRCYRDSMCCPGNHCHNYVCTKRSQRVPGVQKQNQSTRSKTRSSKLRKAGAQCVRSADCAPGHCCARHLWTRVCRAKPREGEACSAVLQNKGSHRVELFQRCVCSSNLTCRPQTSLGHPLTHTHQPGHTHHTPTPGLHTCQ